ncbi:MAG: competence protein ComEC [Candidatus Paceibacteria bacterium]|jgi:competence protein ComEC
MRLKLCILSILLFSVFGTIYYLSNEKESDILKVVFLDVGQGDSIYIEAPNKLKVLIDAGKDGKVKRSLSKNISFYDHLIDMTISTHLDGDHIGGFQDFFNGYKSDLHILASTSTKENEITRSLFSLLNEGEVMVRVSLSGDRIVLDDVREVYLDVLYPSKENLGQGSENDNSIVLRLVYGDTSVLLTGDISGDVEEDLALMYKDQLKSDVLKVAHHGSNDSSTLNFLEKVNPSYAVISSGKDNRYGHPHKETIDRLDLVEALIFDTKELGNIIFLSNGKEIWRE